MPSRIKRARFAGQDRVPGAQLEEFSASQHSASSESSSDSASESESQEISAESENEVKSNSDPSSFDSELDSDAGSESDSENKPTTDRFTTAVDAILGSRVKAHDRQDPILVRNKKPAKEIEEAKLESRAKKLLKAERQQYKDRARVKDAIPRDAEAAGDVLQREKRLKKTAQRGVVRLLNAIHSAQAAAAAPGADTKTGSAAQIEPDLSKEKFLDMIRSG